MSEASRMSVERVVYMGIEDCPIELRTPLHCGERVKAIWPEACSWLQRRGLESLETLSCF